MVKLKHETIKISILAFDVESGLSFAKNIGAVGFSQAHINTLGVDFSIFDMSKYDHDLNFVKKILTCYFNPTRCRHHSLELFGLLYLSQ